MVVVEDCRGSGVGFTIGLWWWLIFGGLFEFLLLGGFGFVHGSDDGGRWFEFYLGIGFEFEFGYWVLFRFELAAVAVGGEIGLSAVMSGYERERERGERDGFGLYYFIV